MFRNQPIGFFDSGSGGLSVLAAFRQVMPQEDYLYFGDHANLPYGTREPEEIRQLTIKACDRLAEFGIKALVVACNTASTAALEALSVRYRFPVLGIEPPLAEAAERKKMGRILMMATPATLHSERYQSLSAPYQDGFMPLPCPGLAELVEAEDAQGQIALLKELFASIDKITIDAIALGCTHYPLIRPSIASAFDKPVDFVDGYRNAAQRLRAELRKAGLLQIRKAQGHARLTTSGGHETALRLERILDRHSALIARDSQSYC